MVKKWHLGAKGFPPGKPPKWDRFLLPRLLDLLRQVEPRLRIAWDVRDAITIRVPESNRFWCRIKTKETASLECWFVGPRGQFNLARLEGIGREPAIDGQRQRGVDLLTIQFVTSDHLNTNLLTPLLREHLAGFRALQTAE